MGKSATFVFVDGVSQEENTYSLSSTSLLFTEAPPLNSHIEVRAFSSQNLDLSDSSSLYRDLLSGDGSTTEFTLNATPVGQNNSFVFISGVYQQKTTYTLVGNTLTFSSAPPSGTGNIEVMSIATGPLGTGNNMSYVAPTPISKGIINKATVALSYGSAKEIAVTRGQAINMVDDISDMEGYASHLSVTGGAGQNIYWVVDDGDSEDLGGFGPDGNEGTLRWCVAQAEANGGGRIIFQPRTPMTVILGSSIYVPGDTTIDAPGRNVIITGTGDISLFRLQPNSAHVINVIIRRLAFHGYWSKTATNRDGISIFPTDSSRTYKVDRFWIDSCSFYSMRDAAIDIASIEVPIAGLRATLSRNLFVNNNHNMIIGTIACNQASPAVGWCATATSEARQIFVTSYRNLFEHCAQRNPKVRETAYVHQVNDVLRIHQMTDDNFNYALSGSYGLSSEMGGHALSENSLYVLARDTGSTIYATDAVTTAFGEAGTDWDGDGVVESTARQSPGFLRVEGSVSDGVLLFSENSPGSVASPAYSLTAATITDTAQGRADFFADVASTAGAEPDAAPEGLFTWSSTSTQEPDGIRVLSLLSTVPGRLIRKDAQTVFPEVPPTQTSSGYYTPTVTGLTNVDSLTRYECTWTQIGSIVTVAGRIDVDPTASGDTRWSLSLPVPNDLTAIGDLAGVASRRTSSDSAPGTIYASTTNDNAEFRMYIGSSSNQEVYFTFTYRF